MGRHDRSNGHNNRNVHTATLLRFSARHHRENEKLPGYVSSTALRVAHIGATDLFPAPTAQPDAMHPETTMPPASEVTNG